MKKFPRDCSEKCPFYSCYDLSIDDFVSKCSLLEMECDDCDMDYSSISCPSPLAYLAVEPEPVKILNAGTMECEWYFVNGDMLRMKINI